MNEIEAMHDILNSNLPDHNKRDRLREYLLAQLERNASHVADDTTIAYDIASLLSTDFARSLAQGDPYSLALNLAGQLELPERHRGGATWGQLTKLVKNLT